MTELLRHHCGGPREACGVPGCLECRAPLPETEQLRKRVAELEAALRGVFEWKEEINADLRLHTDPGPILDAVERALFGGDTIRKQGQSGPVEQRHAVNERGDCADWCRACAAREASQSQ